MQTNTPPQDNSNSNSSNVTFSSTPLSVIDKEIGNDASPPLMQQHSIAETTAVGSITSGDIKKKNSSSSPNSNSNNNNNNNTTISNNRKPCCGGAGNVSHGNKLTRQELLARTVHLRCLPPTMLQGELADLCGACGELRRIRLCGNSKVGQNWIYGFAEFSSPAAADALRTLSGMELSGGEGRAPLRLKCGPAAQPIFDCLPHDADLLRGLPCTFGKGTSADKTLNDALLVVKAAAQGNDAEDGKLGKDGGKKGSTQAAAAAVCDCGCADDPTVRCCSCCKCHKPAAADGTAAAKPSCCSQQAPAAPPPPPPPPPAPPVISSTEAASMLAHAIQYAKSSGTAMDGAHIVGQCQALALQALHALPKTPGTPDATNNTTTSSNIIPMPASGTTGHESAAVHLISLLTLLDRNAILVGGPAETVSGDHTADIPQKAICLRLFAYTSLYMLSLYDRRMTEAMQWLESIVAACQAVPLVPLPPSVVDALCEAEQKQQQEELKKRSAADAMTASAVSPCMYSDNDNICWMPMGSSSHLLGAEEPPTYPLQSPYYPRDIAFHAYVLNVLVAVGMAMEGVQPMISRSAYALAAGRARDVFQKSCPALDAFLAAGQSQQPTSLVAALLPEVAGARDITSVPRAFFTAAEGQRIAMTCDASAFWSLLPPLSCIRCFQGAH